MSKSKKYYVVWSGNEPGVYDSWAETQLQIKGFPNAKYKSFKTKQEAVSAYHGNYDDYLQKKGETQRMNHSFDLFKSEIIMDSISVDAACSGNPGDMEYRGVWTADGTELFRMGPFKMGTNNIGEFLALVHVLALIQKKRLKDYVIYSDSKIAMGWIAKKKINTKLIRSQVNASLFDLIERAEAWLQNNSFHSKILKWDTKRWGEIPADFGRK